MQEYIATVFKAANNLDISFWVSGDKRLKEFDKTFHAILNAGTVLHISCTGVLGDGFSCLAVSNTFQVQVLGIF